MPETIPKSGDFGSNESALRFFDPDHTRVKKLRRPFDPGMLGFFIKLLPGGRRFSHFDVWRRRRCVDFARGQLQRNGMTNRFAKRLL